MQPCLQPACLENSAEGTMFHLYKGPRIYEHRPGCSNAALEFGKKTFLRILLRAKSSKQHHSRLRQSTFQCLTAEDERTR